MSNTLVVKALGCQPYKGVWSQMREFTDQRTHNTADELWLLEHPPVYTLGQAGKEAHILDAGDIEVVHSDRGGQVTYHGPGQLIGYLLVDIKRRQIGVKQLVSQIEQALVSLLQSLDIDAVADPAAHGVYVSGRKIAALGLRVRKNCTYHGFSLNIDMDLEPFTRINPCGFAGLEVTDIVSEGANVKVQSIQDRVVGHVQNVFGYTAPLHPKKNIAVS